VILLLRFFLGFFTFFQSPKSRDFLRFLPRFVRFLELCRTVTENLTDGDVFKCNHIPPTSTRLMDGETDAQ